MSWWRRPKPDPLVDIRDTQRVILARLTSIERTINHMSADITGLGAKLDELGTAISTEIQQLRDAIAALGASAEVLAEVDAAKARIQGFTDSLKADDTPPVL